MTTELVLDASARRVLDLMANSGYPPIEALPIVEARVAARLGFIAMQAPKFDVHSVRDLQMPGPGGDDRIAALSAERCGRVAGADLFPWRRLRHRRSRTLRRVLSSARRQRRLRDRVGRLSARAGASFSCCS
jgi:hypothetical protein